MNRSSGARFVAVFSVVISPKSVKWVFRHRYTDKQQKQCGASRRGPAKNHIASGPTGQTVEIDPIAVILISISLALVAWCLLRRHGTFRDRL